MNPDTFKRALQLCDAHLSRNDIHRTLVKEQDKSRRKRVYLNARDVDEIVREHK